MEIIKSFFNFEIIFFIWFGILIISTFALIIGLYLFLKYYRREDNADIVNTKLLHAPFFVGLLMFVGSTFVILGGIFGIYIHLSPTPTGVFTYPEKSSELPNYDHPIEVTFNVPVWKDRIEPHINPEVEGRWDTSYFYSGFPWTRRIRFYPDKSFLPNQKVMIYLSYLANELNPNSGNEYLLEFYTPPLPKGLATQPIAREENVPINQKLAFMLDRESTFTSDWMIKSNPEEEFDLKIEGNLINATPRNMLKQGTAYTVTLMQTPVTYSLKDNSIIDRGQTSVAIELAFTTVKSPELTSYQPTGDGILTNTPIVINFDTPVILPNDNSYLAIDPPTDGSYNWNEEKTVLTFNAVAPWQKDTTYTVTIKKGLKNINGGMIESDFPFQFKTIGPVQTTASNPINNATGIQVNTPISVTFNQAVKHESAESKFSINPNVAGSFSWNENTLNYNLSQSLEYSTRYTVNIADGVESIDGLPSAISYPNSFTTAPNQINLAVPLYEQPDGFSCNLTAIRMALAYRGVSVSHSQVLNAIGTNGSRGNGNPYKGFVDGYGVYWQPFEGFVGQYRGQQVFTNWNLTDLLKEVEKGNPVVVWGQNGWSTPNDISWTASDGTHVYAISGMHSYVVKGFTGTPDNPGVIYINDPWRGVISMSPGTFNDRWSYFRTAMVIY